MKAESLSRKRVAKREYLNDADTKGLMGALNQILRDNGRYTKNTGRQETDNRDAYQRRSVATREVSEKRTKNMDATNFSCR